MLNRLAPIQKRWNLLALALLAILLAACTSLPVPSNLQTSAAEPLDTTPEPMVTVQVTDVDVDRLAEMLVDTAPVQGESTADGFDGVNVFPVEAAATPTLWVAHTYGIRPFDPQTNHFVALYHYENQTWIEVARHELECPDYVARAGVSQTAISPDSVWLAVDGGAGAHSGCFVLLRWNGDEFAVAAEGTNASPSAGMVADVDGDGQLDVILNETDPYVFCYACGVRLYGARILRWNGDKLVAVELQPLPESAPTELRDLNNRAVALANASLYLDALPLIQEALTLAPDNEIVYWNARAIQLYAENRLEHAANGAYPLLAYVFYGDYAAAVEQMRHLSPSEIFSLESPLLVDTVADGWVNELSRFLSNFAGDAIAVQPDLAEAYFLRGWGRFLANPSDPDAVTDVNRAAQLAPDDPLIVESATYLQGIASSRSPTALSTTPEATTATTVRFAPGATAELIRVDLQADPEQRFQLEVGGGQSAYVTAPADVRVDLQSSTGSPLSGSQAGGATEFVIPSSGIYTLLVRGNRAVDLLLYIPPLNAFPNAPSPDNVERIRFAPGATGATVETTLLEDTAKGYVLGIGGGQSLFVFLSDNGGYNLLDPQGRLLTPVSADPTGSAHYTIPYSGDYTIVLHGSGPVILTTQIPPP